MRDNYWAMFNDTKYEYFYFDHYKRASQKLELLITGFTLAVSSSAISSWLFWQRYPIVWAVLIAISQLISSFQHLLPYGKQVSALEHLLPEMESIIASIEHSWVRLHMNSDEEIGDLIYSYRTKLMTIQNKYLSGIYMPWNDGYSKIADDNTRKFFEYHYNVERMDIVEASKQ